MTNAELLNTTATELARKIPADPILQAAALLGPDAYAAALEAELPRILEQHRVDIQKAFITLEMMTGSADHARKVRSYFAPRIYAAVNA